MLEIVSDLFHFTSRESARSATLLVAISYTDYGLNLNRTPRIAYLQYVQLRFEGKNSQPEAWFQF